MGVELGSSPSSALLLLLAGRRELFLTEKDGGLDVLGFPGWKSHGGGGDSRQ